MCIDYIEFIANTIIDAYIIPYIDYISYCLGGSVIFIKIEFAQSYHQVQISKGHKHRTSFQVRFKLFEYRVVPFGL